jgi:hypothetical protein
VRRALYFASLLAGCIGSKELELPPEASQARAALLALETPDGAEVFAIDLVNGGFAPITTQETPLYLFLYGSDLITLGIAPGKVERPGDSVDKRPLPDAQIFVARLPDTEWSMTDRDALPESIESFRLPDLPLGSCEGGGGCFRIVEGDEFCQQPCIEPSNAEPASPMETAPPAAPVLTTPGGACPAGMYRNDVPGTAILVPSGGDIQAAIAASSPGDVIAVAKGTYTAALSIDRAVTVVGACAETVIAADVDMRAGASLETITVVGTIIAGGPVDLSDVVIERSRAVGLTVIGTANVTARRLALRSNRENLRVEGGIVTIEDATFEAPIAESNASVVGVAEVTLRRALLTGSRRFGLYATAGTVRLEDVAIRDHDGSLNQGEGVVVDGPVVIEARRLAIERVERYGIRVLTRGEKAELRLDDLTLREVAGIGIEMGTVFSPAAESSYTIHRMFAEKIDELAVTSVTGQANEITDLVLRDAGIASVGGVLHLGRAELSGILGPSLDVTSGEMLLDDLRIIDAENGLVTEGWISTDVSAIDAAMTVNRFEISGATGAGILVHQFSRMRLIAGRISDNNVGVEVRADGFIYSALEGDVIYHGNRMHNLLNVGQMPQ